MLEILTEPNKEEFFKLFKNSNLSDFINIIAPYINKRSYLKINIDGSIKKNTMNYALPLLSVLNMENEREILDLIYDNYLDSSQKIKINKIDRLAKESIEKLEKNLYKIFFNRDRIFALKYSKELFLKDKKKMMNCLYRYALMNDITSKKVLMILAFENLIDNFKVKNEIDGLLYSVVDYLVSFESNFYFYETVADTSITSITEIEKMIDKNECEIASNLEIVTYFNGIKRLALNSEERIDKFLNILLEKIKKQRNHQELEKKGNNIKNSIFEEILLKNLNKR